MKHGAGTYSKPNGTFFQGTWVRNQRLEFGKGKLIDDNPNAVNKEYHGDLRSTKPHGLGVKIAADNSVYVGGFSNGRPSGAGISKDLQNNTTYLASFKKNKKENNRSILI